MADETPKRKKPRPPKRRARPRRKKVVDIIRETAKYDPHWIDQVDLRRNEVISVLALREALFKDLGGMENISTQRQLLVDRAVFFARRLMALEHMDLEGETIDWNHYAYLTNTLNGLMKTLGLDKVTGEIQSLKDYVDSHATEVEK